MRGLISLVNDNHVDNKLKDILVYVYLGSIVNNRPKNGQNVPCTCISRTGTITCKLSQVYQHLLNYGRCVMKWDEKTLSERRKIRNLLDV